MKIFREKSPLQSFPKTDGFESLDFLYCHIHFLLIDKYKFATASSGVLPLAYTPYFMVTIHIFLKLRGLNFL